jgi:uncharacterized protein YbaR (Trm112 family)
MIEKELLEILACPACRAGVREVENEIVCMGCGRRYPVQDGIPVMLVEEARGPREPPPPASGRGP